jgi:hypothetical protein
MVGVGVNLSRAHWSGGVLSCTMVVWVSLTCGSRTDRGGTGGDTALRTGMRCTEFGGGRGGYCTVNTAYGYEMH